MANLRTESNPRPGARASLLLDPCFYPRRLILQAAADYQKMAEIRVARAGDRLRVEFSGMNRHSARRLPDEFSNYLLALLMESR